MLLSPFFFLPKNPPPSFMLWCLGLPLSLSVYPHLLHSCHLHVHVALFSGRLSERSGSYQSATHSCVSYTTVVALFCLCQFSWAPQFETVTESQTERVYIFPVVNRENDDQVPTKENLMWCSAANDCNRRKDLNNCVNTINSLLSPFSNNWNNLFDLDSSSFFPLFLYLLPGKSQLIIIQPLVCQHRSVWSLSICVASNFDFPPSSITIKGIPWVPLLFPLVLFLG